MNDKKQCEECGEMFGPKPYNPATGSNKLNMYAFNIKTYCSMSCKNSATSRKRAHQNAVWARYKRMCKRRLDAAFVQFMYTGEKTEKVTL